MSSKGTGKSGLGIEEMHELYKTSPFAFGAGDIFSCGPFDTLEHVADLLFILSMIEDANGKTPITEFTVILPPASEHTAEDVKAAFSNAVARHRGSLLDERELEILPRRLKVVDATDLQVQTVVALIESARRNSVVIICDGAKCRDEALDHSPPAERTIRLEEDAWVRHFHSLAVKALAAAKQNELYVALNTGRWCPHRQTNVDLLKSVDDCGIRALANSNDVDGFLAAHSDQWLADIKDGRIGSVLASIDSLPDAVGILDAWSRRVVGYAIGRSIDARLALAALKVAIKRPARVSSRRHRSGRIPQVAGRPRHSSARRKPDRSGLTIGVDREPTPT